MASIRVVNLAEKLSTFDEYWSPRIAGELNDNHVKLAKLKGEFVWHHHEQEDEMFLVVRGTLRMGVRENGVERELTIGPGEYVIIPRGIEHLPKADEEVHLLLVEPKTTLNTGNLRNERTREELPTV
jgi:mannose-6-phosphate isomerase-like protein (cupin superfamily)